MNVKLTILLFVVTIGAAVAQAQDTVKLSQQLSPKYLEQVVSKAGGLEQKMDKQTAKALQQWQKQESKIKKKLSKIDSLKASELFGNAEQKYKQLEQKLQGKVDGKRYLPAMDTLASSLKFLQQNSQLLSQAKDVKEKLSTAISKVNGLDQQFQRAEDVKNFLKERRQLLKEQLGKLGFAKQLKKLNKQSYYYSQQLNEYKSMLKDHKKAERKALELLSKTKAFQNFMRKNSQLASLFRMPGGGADPTGNSLAGLQTRQQVNELLQQQIGAGGPDARQQLTQNLQEAKDQMNQLKEKMQKAGMESSDEEMPDFKPNGQKKKSFWKRIELGTNFQSQKSNGYFPVTSDMGLSVGYKLNDKSTIGLGSSYKIGWGQNIRHIKMSHQGIGMRSFADWKIKGSFWLSGGYEMNYRSEIKSIEVLRDYSAWQQSGLVGMSKVISLRTKFFKKTKVQLLWDFLSYRQVPRGQAILFRIGYSF